MGARACDRKAFKKYLEDSDRNTYFIGIGDLYDSIVVRDKRYRKSSDNTIGDAIIDEQVDDGVDLLMPYKDRIIGLGFGNHEDTILIKAGTDLTNRTCRRLDVPHLGLSGLRKLIFREGSGRGRSVVIYYHHGYGHGSRTAGGALTKYSKNIPNFDADLFLFGHDHQKDTKVFPRLGMVGDKLMSKDKRLCLCGTFLRTYLPGIEATYGEKHGYPPVPIGGTTIMIKPTREWVDINVI
ncbi:MAG: hypothetical protein ACFFCW_00205 [Candidatus Hodarchaeota archaeon]